MFSRRSVFYWVLFSFIFVGNAWAGGAATKRQQMGPMKAQMQQQIIAQQKMMLQQQAAQQAAIIAQRQAQQMAVQAAAQQDQAYGLAAQVSLRQRLQQERGMQAGQNILVSQGSNLDAEVKEEATLNDVLTSLDNSGQDWPLLIDQQAKEVVIDQYIQRYNQQGVAIRKPAAHYAQMIDAMSAQAPEMLQRPFPKILEAAAILEYDFENGYDKDAMARKILGSEQAVMANKERLGIR